MRNRVTSGALAGLLMAAAGAAHGQDAAESGSVISGAALERPYALAASNISFSDIDRGYDSRKYSKTFKIKGWQVRRGVYFGGAKIAGEYGPGFIIEKQGYSWGFNHQGVQLHIPLD